jgi:hypothetical protein
MALVSISVTRLITLGERKEAKSTMGNRDIN